MDKNKSIRYITLLIFFLIINFGGLAIGSWLMNNGPMTDWYLSLNKAPWTPPGWVFGLSWTTIMMCFSWFLVELYKHIKLKTFIILLVVEFILNVGWNYIFFNKHLIALGLLALISLITLLFYYFSIAMTRNYKWLLAPYLLWLCIAISLNLYILIHN